jgi:glycine cleavage system H lipoate-binding protein
MSDLEYPDNLRYTADHEWVDQLDGGSPPWVTP